jgi:polysaccharide deacetylase family protein (PEP-CTERM system associated)
MGQRKSGGSAAPPRPPSAPHCSRCCGATASGRPGNAAPREPIGATPAGIPPAHALLIGWRSNPARSSRILQGDGLHHFTVDVEEYFHASALEALCPMERWPLLEPRAAPVVHRLLDLLSERKVRGTFFVLGWLADRDPGLVRRIAAEGHEVASHGWDHRRIPTQSPARFRDSVRRARALLQDLSSSPVEGFRAPSFSIIPGFEWALDILVEEGHAYDSSLFPVRQHPGYGYPCPVDPHWIRRPTGPLLEMPPATLRWMGTNLPAAGGAYFRVFPLGLIGSALDAAERRGAPGTFYIHPWEFDDEIPRLGEGPLTGLRMRMGTGRSWSRVERLLDRFTFRTMGETLQEFTSRASAA